MGGLGQGASDGSERAGVRLPRVRPSRHHVGSSDRDGPAAGRPGGRVAAECASARTLVATARSVSARTLVATARSVSARALVATAECASAERSWPPRGPRPPERSWRMDTRADRVVQPAGSRRDGSETTRGRWPAGGRQRARLVRRSVPGNRAAARRRRPTPRPAPRDRQARPGSARPAARPSRHGGADARHGGTRRRSRTRRPATAR
jgi:hypothetical protein